MIDRTNYEAAFIDIAIPLTHSLQATITEKQCQYQDLAFEMKQQCQLNKNFILLVLSAMGVIPNMLTIVSLTSIYHHAYCPRFRMWS